MISFSLKKYGALMALLIVGGCGGVENQKINTFEEFCIMIDKKITSVDDVYQFFPKSVSEIKSYSEYAIQRARRDLDVLIEHKTENRTFENTARSLDAIGADFGRIAHAISILEMVSPDEAIRNACHEEIIKLQTFAVDAFSNKNLYNACKAYVDGNAHKEQLSHEQRYYLDETMRDFIRAGLSLPDDKLEEVKSIKKELAALSLEFDTNINNDKTKIAVDKQDLAGCDDHFIQNLQRDDHGKYLLGCDYPTYFEIMEQCSVGQTRKQLYFAYNNRAHPQNTQLLEKIIAKRDELAQKLGFASYAALDIDDQMVKTPERAEAFIKDLVARAHVKADIEFKEFSKDLPAGVSLDGNGQFNPWDLGFVKSVYKKKHFKIDERKVAEYFPAERALQGVFDIYQRFLSLEFTVTKPAWAWHEDVQLIAVRDKNTQEMRGYLFLDLYPRDNKYSHACHCDVVATTRRQLPDGTIEFIPNVALVIANFPKSTADRPALLKHRDVETFFHEFGHAMHALLGSTEMSSFSGTSVKCDFVEMPSQIFEEWMFDKELLKSLSHHYQTGEQLSDELIDNIIALKKYDSGMHHERQSWLSLISLECFKPGAVKNTSSIVQGLAANLIPHVRFEPDTHMQASFGHLTNYGAKYYGYQWSKVFALDLFYVIKDQGLVNPEAGKVFVDKILAKGGSVDPNILLRDYLGREPNQDAFFKDLGITG